MSIFDRLKQLCCISLQGRLSIVRDDFWPEPRPWYLCCPHLTVPSAKETFQSTIAECGWRYQMAFCISHLLKEMLQQFRCWISFSQYMTSNESDAAELAWPLRVGEWLIRFEFVWHVPITCQRSLKGSARISTSQLLSVEITQQNASAKYKTFNACVH